MTPRPRSARRIAAAKADPDRWLSLVRFAVLTDQPAKAEKAVHEAEANLVKQPLALAQCCQLVGNAYAAVDPDRAKSWFDQARHWFAKAQAEIKDPDDLTVKAPLRRVPPPDQPGSPRPRGRSRRSSRGRDAASRPTSSPGAAQPGPGLRAATPPRTAEALALFAGKAGRPGRAGRPARPGLDPRGPGDSGGPAAGHRRPRDADRAASPPGPRIGAGWPSSWRPPANGPGPASNSAS